MDQGSRNMAYNTKRLIKGLEMILSPSRAHRLNDNSRQERWYLTVQQEAISYQNLLSKSLVKISHSVTVCGGVLEGP